MTDLDSEAHPNPFGLQTGTLRVSALHTLYWEQSGNPQGTPVVIVHGGPGGSMKDYYRTILDQERFRIIGFDQRGCGRSTPFGELQENTTQALIADMERLRVHLGLSSWYLLGGSWGSTLALAYAQRHPAAVQGLVVTGVHLADDRDRQWWWKDARYVYPDAYAYLLSHLKEAERGDVRASYLSRVFGGDPEVSQAAAATLMLYEARLLAAPAESPMLRAMQANLQATAAMGRMFCHYDRHEGFLEEGQLLRGAHVLRGVPGAIIAGRSDMCTPPLAASELARHWPDAQLCLLSGAGHRWDDPALVAQVRLTFDRWAGDAG